MLLFFFIHSLPCYVFDRYSFTTCNWFDRENKNIVDCIIYQSIYEQNISLSHSYNLEIYYPSTEEKKNVFRLRNVIISKLSKYHGTFFMHSNQSDKTKTISIFSANVIKSFGIHAVSGTFIKQTQKLNRKFICKRYWDAKCIYKSLMTMTMTTMMIHGYHHRKVLNLNIFPFCSFLTSYWFYYIRCCNWITNKPCISLNTTMIVQCA